MTRSRTCNFGEHRYCQGKAVGNRSKCTCFCHPHGYRKKIRSNKNRHSLDLHLEKAIKESKIFGKW
jgi:hypothetical protein